MKATRITSNNFMSPENKNNEGKESATRNEESIEFIEKPLEKVDEQDDFKHREGGFLAWLVVVASGYCFGILIGMMNNYALIYNGLEKEYNSTENYVVYTGKQSSKV